MIKLCTFYDFLLMEIFIIDVNCVFLLFLHHRRLK